MNLPCRTSARTAATRADGNFPSPAIWINLAVSSSTFFSLEESAIAVSQGINAARFVASSALMRGRRRMVNSSFLLVAIATYSTNNVLPLGILISNSLHGLSASEGFGFQKQAPSADRPANSPIFLPITSSDDRGSKSADAPLETQRISPSLDTSMRAGNAPSSME